ncbi:MAG: hypothetical protein K8S97_05605 [Anaerolineae bacterium]|nr:hypothetical protein [Anaerolineae bacterium]
MTEISSITVLYTANLRGALHLLPQLSTLIQGVRRVAEGPVFLLDLGDTCAKDAWVCQATQGRAPFLVLDSMGYDAAVIGGNEQVPIPPSALRQLVQHNDMVMPVIIWQRPKTLTKRGVQFTVLPGIVAANATSSNEAPALRIDRGAATLPDVGSSHPVLGDVPQGHLAGIDIAWPAWTVQHAKLLALEATIPIDPSIAAVVELVESEARQQAQKHGGPP